jgi:hypothetical protein
MQNDALAERVIVESFQILSQVDIPLNKITIPIKSAELLIAREKCERPLTRIHKQIEIMISNGKLIVLNESVSYWKLSVDVSQKTKMNA